MVPGVGLEPPECADVSPLSFFSADLLPLFSFLGNSAFQVTQSLAGDERIDRSKNPLSLLQQYLAWRVRKRDQVFDFGDHQASKMRQHEALVRWDEEGSLRRYATLSVQGMFLSVFRLVAEADSLPLFFIFARAVEARRF